MMIILLTMFQWMHYQTPIKKTCAAPINDVETDSVTQYSPSTNSYPTTSPLSTHSKAVKHSLASPRTQINLVVIRILIQKHKWPQLLGI